MCMHMHVHVHVHVVPAAYMCTRTRATGLHSGCSRTTPPRRPTNLPCYKHTHAVCQQY